MKKTFGLLLIILLVSNLISCASINGRTAHYYTYPFITTREGTITLGVEFLAFIVPMLIDGTFSAVLDTILLPYDATQCIYRNSQ
ncbi:YceK/YidQ family lipoprotein [Zooshikella harenae]|uniref:YceK/YidQ family lipoprotein n=1 Tax=Zooshikella harenae TaxID=2827238 RepID=A0ABS5ZIP5_9GAMM|nr:YceK/YidQ family lipoprotein [Zooshikella harenae]MBU2713795.1 YceK/YidQ family lipoprotein [Zooshikella harenae]